MNGVPTTLVVVAFALGTATCLATSWLAVQRLERLGERFGFSEAALGLLAAFAADAPEITAAVTALAHHHHAVGAGVALGSNVFNLAALLGLGALVAGRLRLHRRVVVLGGTVALWIAAWTAAAVAGSCAAPVALAASLAVLVPYIVALATGPTRIASGAGRRGPAARRALRWLAAAVEDEEDELSPAIRPAQGRAVDAAVAVVAVAAVVVASIAMESAATTLGNRWSVPGILVGGLVLAAATSLPNAVAAVYLASRGRGAAVLSTAFNSNAFNAVAGLLVPAVAVGSVDAGPGGLLVAASFVGLTALAVGLAHAGRGLGRAGGAVLVGSYVIFAITLAVSA
ncbi:MAG: sodium/calcium exchanger protein [Actinomycetota bacterium]|nr:sodium/calcium exchanger protein [Actinomycetota bacterium]